MAGPVLKRSKTQEQLDLVKTKKLELELAHKKGELVLARDIERLWVEAMITFRNKLLNLPQALALELSEADGPEEIQVILDRELRHALDELSEMGLREASKNEKGGAIEDEGHKREERSAEGPKEELSSKGE